MGIHATIYASDDGCNPSRDGTVPSRWCSGGLSDDCNGRTAGVRCCSSDSTCISLCNRSRISAAVQLCAAHGQRLCTRDEMWQSCCKTGCGFDSLHVWTTLPSPPPRPALRSSLRPGTLWLDSDGNPIRAHTAGIYADDAGAYYWVGADSYRQPAAGHTSANKQLNIYSSFDLYNWRFRAVAFQSPIHYADRPKVVRSSKGQFVMWFKSTPFGTRALQHPTPPLRSIL